MSRKILLYVIIMVPAIAFTILMAHLIFPDKPPVGPTQKSPKEARFNPSVDCNYTQAGCVDPSRPEITKD